jgi:hypothetical protein
MSKVPQRGEIWKSEDYTVYIIGIHNSIVNYVYEWRRCYYSGILPMYDFEKLYKYVGNSMVDVGDIFSEVIYE